LSAFLIATCQRVLLVVPRRTPFLLGFWFFTANWAAVGGLRVVVCALLGIVSAQEKTKRNKIAILGRMRIGIENS
jgi:hypothetical protein